MGEADGYGSRRRGTVRQGGRVRGARGGPVLVGALALDSLGNGLFLPLSLVYFERTTDLPLVAIGAAVTAATLLTLPLPVWAGALADRFGPLPLVVAAQLLQAVGFAGYALVGGPGLRSVVGVVVAAALVAAGVRVFWSTVFTAVALYVDNRDGPGPGVDTWFALCSGARTAGFAVGGLVTAVVVTAGPEVYRPIAWSTAGCFLVAAFVISCCVRTGPIPGSAVAVDADPPAHYRALLRDRPFLVLTTLNVVYALSSMMLALALPVLVARRPEVPVWLVGVVLAGNSLLIACLSGPVVHRLRGIRRTRSLAVAAALWAGWSLAFAAVASLGPLLGSWVVPVLLVSTLLFTVAELVHAPVSTALAAAMAPEVARGRWLAVFQYSFTIASIVAPTFFTGLDALDPAVPWLVLAAANLAGVAGLRWLGRTLPTPSLVAPR